MTGSGITVKGLVINRFGGSGIFIWGPGGNKIIGNYIVQVEIENGAINVQFGNRSNQAIDGKWLSLRPGVVAAAHQVPISWRCGAAQPVDGLTYSGSDRTDLTPQVLPIDCRL